MTRFRERCREISREFSWSWSRQVTVNSREFHLFLHVHDTKTVKGQTAPPLITKPTRLPGCSCGQSLSDGCLPRGRRRRSCRCCSSDRSSGSDAPERVNGLQVVVALEYLGVASATGLLRRSVGRGGNNGVNDVIETQLCLKFRREFFLKIR